MVAAETALLEGAQAGAERLRLVGAGAAALLEPADSRLERARGPATARRLARGQVTLALGECCLLLGERVAARRELVLRAYERLLGLAQLRQLRLDPLELVRGGGGWGASTGAGGSARPRARACSARRAPRARVSSSAARARERGLALGDRARALRELGLAGIEARRARVELVGDGRLR